MGVSAHEMKTVVKRGVVMGVVMLAARVALVMMVVILIQLSG